MRCGWRGGGGGRLLSLLYSLNPWLQAEIGVAAVVSTVTVTARGLGRKHATMDGVRRTLLARESALIELCCAFKSVS